MINLKFIKFVLKNMFRKYFKKNNLKIIFKMSKMDEMQEAICWSAGKNTPLFFYIVEISFLTQHTFFFTCFVSLSSLLFSSIVFIIY